MYNELFSKSYDNSGRYITVHILSKLEGEIYNIPSSAQISTYSKFSCTVNHHINKSPITIPENVEWVIVETDRYADIYVTEYTKRYVFDIARNKIFNNLISKTQLEYLEYKKKTFYLYFWNSDRKRLNICKNNCYSRDSYGQAIDRKYETPLRDCFILGRICKTIGISNNRQFDYIEPVCIIYLDFDKSIGDYTDYRYCILDLELCLYNLLSFCTKIDDALTFGLKCKRVENYLFESYKSSYPKIEFFMDELKKAFKNGDVNKLRGLEKVLSTKQDCYNAKFQMDTKGCEEFTCLPTKNFLITYDNGESELATAKWIAQNISRCTNKQVVHYQLRNEYNFF